MSEQNQGAAQVGDPERPAALRQHRPLAVALGRQPEIAQAGERDRNPDQNLLVLAVRAIAEPACEAAAGEQNPPGARPPRRRGGGRPAGCRPGRLPRGRVRPILPISLEPEDCRRSRRSATASRRSGPAAAVAAVVRERGILQRA
jgi:hypothetical protein